MSLEDILNSATQLMNPIPAKFADGTPIALQHVGQAASFLLVSCADAKADHPELWQAATAALMAADEHPTDREKARAAWLATFNLLRDAGRIL